MLYEAAIAILTRIRRAFKLRLWGLRLMKKKGLKRAATAVARSLAVLLHKIWVDGVTFLRARGHETRPGSEDRSVRVSR